MKLAPGTRVQYAIRTLEAPRTTVVTLINCTIIKESNRPDYYLLKGDDGSVNIFYKDNFKVILDPNNLLKDIL